MFTARRDALDPDLWERFKFKVPRSDDKRERVFLRSCTTLGIWAIP